MVSDGTLDRQGVLGAWHVRRGRGGDEFSYMQPPVCTLAQLPYGASSMSGFRYKVGPENSASACSQAAWAG